MTDKRQDLIIDPKDFHVFLKARMMTDSVAEYAAKKDINPKLLYMMLQGKRAPSKEILKKVDLEVAYRAKARRPGQQDLIIDPRDFPVFLKARMMTDSVAEYAEKTGIHQQLMYYMLQGNRPPSAEVLKKVGLEIVYRAKAKPEKK
jgi:predicted transcriptional regulator